MFFHFVCIKLCLLPWTCYWKLPYISLESSSQRSHYWIFTFIFCYELNTIVLEYLEYLEYLELVVFQDDSIRRRSLGGWLGHQSRDLIYRISAFIKEILDSSLPPSFHQLIQWENACLQGCKGPAYWPHTSSLQYCEKYISVFISTLSILCYSSPKAVGYVHKCMSTCQVP